MPTYISMLRGINVSGQKTIRMADLKDLYESLGFTDVTTYIQSGNVLFNAKEMKPSTISAATVKAIREKFGFEVTVVIREPKELGTIIRKNPFAKRKGIDKRMLHVIFLASKPDAALVRALVPFAAKSNDEYEVIGSEIYLHCPTGYGQTLLNNTFFEKHLKIAATTRNWNSVNALHSLAGEHSD